MVHIGNYNFLTVKRSAPEGLILTDGEQDILLPQRVKTAATPGEELFVFVYHHKDGRVIATDKRPYACVGDFAFLKVVDETETGAYLDLGIDKDVFIPAKQKQPLEIGREYVVYVYLDERDGKMAATTWLDDHIDTEVPDLEEGEEVSLLIYDTSELGYSAIINNRYGGLLYRNEVYEALHVGQTCTGFVKKIRPETNKIDLSLRPIGFDFILDSKNEVLDLLKENGGVLALGDKSDPGEIRERLKMSKKAFKQVIGGLYRERLITLSDYEIRLVNTGN